MCIGAPGLVVDVYDAGTVRMAKVDFGGEEREVCLAYLPDAEPGAWVFVHLGFATSRVTEAEALESIALLREIESRAAGA